MLLSRIPTSRTPPQPSPASQGRELKPAHGYNCGMRLLLQQRPDGREAPRFVQLQLQPDLLGGWTLLRESGQIGGRSTLKREQYTCLLYTSPSPRD